MKEACILRKNISIGYGFGSKDVIEIQRCCVNKNQVYKTFEIKDLLEVDIIKELKDVVEVQKKPVKYVKCINCEEKCDFDTNKFDDLYIQLSIFNQCNANCIFCPYDKTKNIITKIVYLKYLYELKNKNLSITLTDAGEPLLLAKETKEWFRSLKPGDFNYIYFNTNGILIDDEFIELFKNCPIMLEFNVSLNATDRETYKKQMGVDAFDKVVSNINKMSEEIPNIFSSVSFVYTKNLFNKLDNIREIVKKTPIRLTLQNGDPNLFTKEELDYFDKIKNNS